ncbi:MAG: hypothetical protein Q9175_007201, partial [Cornicularia normoerica]
MKAFMTRFLRSPALYTIAIPTPTATEILVKVAYVSLNPTDHKHASMSLPPSKILGCEFSGTVADPKASSFHKGDRIAGVIHGCKDSRTGGFADFLVADPGMCFLVPQRVGLEEACTLGVGWMSATQALQQRLFEEVDEGGKGLGERDALLVYSAATNTGMHTIQQAHLLYPSIYIIAVASTQHHARLQALGADACFDYTSPTIEKDVKALGKNVTRAIDCHSEGPSTVSCAQLMGNAGGQGLEGRIVRTLPPGMIQGTVPQGVRADEWILSYTALGK